MNGLVEVVQLDNDEARLIIRTENGDAAMVDLTDDEKTRVARALLGVLGERHLAVHAATN